MTQYDDLAEIYDFEWINLKEDIEFVKELAVKSGGPVLELACGTGRLMFPVAEEGIEIVGLDNSRRMLDIGKVNLTRFSKEAQENCTFDYGDMSDFILNRKFPFVFIPFNSFLLLTDKKSQENCLRCVYEHMSDDGFGMVDIFSPNFSLCAKPVSDIRFLRHFAVPSQEKVVIQWEYVERDMANQVLEIDFLYEIYDKKGNVDQKTTHLSMALIFRYEMQYMLEKTGFEVIEFYGNYDKSPFSMESPQLIYTFRKKK